MTSETKAGGWLDEAQARLDKGPDALEVRIIANRALSELRTARNEIAQFAKHVDH